MGRDVISGVAGGIAVRTRGEVLDRSRSYVRAQVAAFVRRLPAGLPGRPAGRVESARITLTWSARPGPGCPALAQANLEIGGQPIRAQVAAAFFCEAGRLLRARLGAQVARLVDPATPRPWPGPPVPVAVPVRAGGIVREKRYTLARCTPDRAALTMDLMDYDFHLFTDAETGQDAVVQRVGPTGYRLARLSGVAPPSPRPSTPMTINVHPVPGLTPQQAVTRLEETELPFRFFRDTATGRGSVVYRRYDGRYGLVTAATDGPDGQ